MYSRDDELVDLDQSREFVGHVSKLLPNTSVTYSEDVIQCKHDDFIKEDRFYEAIIKFFAGE
jgi:hypothetical protein